MGRPIHVAIIGAGMGGLTTAAILTKAGFKVDVYEQARRFARLGAGIQQSSNAVRIARALGLENRLREIAFQPPSTKYRRSDTGDLLWEKEQGLVTERQFGAPHLMLHRGDLHDLLASAVPPECLQLGLKLDRFEDGDDGVKLVFADGSEARADLLIGADGVHSVVREQLFGAEKPRYTGRVAYRTTFPAHLLKGYEIDDCTKWIAADRHIVIYYINPRRDEVYFVTSTPEPDFKVESWSATGSLEELRAAYAGFHPQVRHVLDCCPEVHKWALVERDPMPRWSVGHVTLLGDACHPMTPYFAQGAATAMEDAAVLSRCLAGVSRDRIGAALLRYEDNRKERTALIQEASRLNSVEKMKSEMGRVYGYDAWTVPLTDEAAVAAE